MYRRTVLEVAAGSMVAALGVGAVPATAGGRAPAGGTASTDDRTATGGQVPTTDAGTDFAPLASLPVEGAGEAVVGPDGTTVFVAADDGFAVVDVADPTEPRLVAERRGLLADDGDPMADVQDVAVDGDGLLVVGPAHPGAEGPRAALLYDVSDPADPRRLAVHRTDYPIHNGALDGRLAYLTANDGGANPLEIVAMEPAGDDAKRADEGEGADEEGAEPRVLGRWSVVDEDEAWADVPSRIRPIHDVIVHRGVAYCSYWDAGTWLVDVSDPRAPSALGRVGERSAAELAEVDDPGRESVELPGNHHSAAIDESGTLLAVGHEAWDDDDDGEGGPAGIDLVDVSTHGSPAVHATIEPPPTDDPTREGVWTTAHNFELRDGILYSAWYQGGVRVHDVSDPTAPREVAAWRDPETTRFWTAQLADGADAGDGEGAGTVVAPSMGTDDGAAGLYTFPDPASVAERRTAGRVTVTPGMAGFGAVAALVGAGLASLLAGRRRR